MTRPSAEIIMGCEDGLSQLDILHADTMWVVLYKKQPFNARRTYINGENLNPVIKYLKTSFTTSAPAHTLSMKLNNIFKCKDFTVEEVL